MKKIYLTLFIITMILFYFSIYFNNIFNYIYFNEKPIFITNTKFIKYKNIMKSENSEKPSTLEINKINENNYRINIKNHYNYCANINNSYFIKNKNNDFSLVILEKKNPTPFINLGLCNRDIEIEINKYLISGKFLYLYSNNKIEKIKIPI